MHSILHIINRSPFSDGSLQQCFKLSNEKGIILLIEDAVVAALANNPMADIISTQARQIPIYVLQADLAARGLASEPLIKSVNHVDYHGFVDLIAQCNTSISWT